MDTRTLLLLSVIAGCIVVDALSLRQPRGHRTRRQTPAAPYNYFDPNAQGHNELYFDAQCPLTVDKIIERQNAHNVPTLIRRNYDPNANPTTDANTNPIVSVTTLQTHSYFREHAQNVQLLLNTFALITRHTIIANRNERRNDFGTAERDHQSGLDKIIDDESDPKKRNSDELGHVVAARLGGPASVYNVFPQPRTHNRGPNTRWTELEHEIEQFVGNHPNRYVEFTAALSYATDVSFNIVHRPTAVVVRARYYINRRLVDPRELSHLNSVADNAYEKIYFTNDPTCTPLPRENKVQLHPTRRNPKG